MRVTPGIQRTLVAFGFLAASLVLLSAGEAHARSEMLRWTHPDPGRVAGFVVHWGTSSGAYDVSTDIGLPPASSGGVFSYPIEVPDNLDVYVAISAYDGAGSTSPYSNEGMRSSDETGGGSSGGGSPFTLYLATQPYATGGIPLQGEDVAASTFMVYAGPDSEIDRVEFWVDDPGRSGPAAAVENAAPYSLGGNGSGGELNPASQEIGELSAGAHVLTAVVTTFDGSISVTEANFTVGGVTLGTPGRPTLVP